MATIRRRGRRWQAVIRKAGFPLAQTLRLGRAKSNAKWIAGSSFDGISQSQRLWEKRGTNVKQSVVSFSKIPICANVSFQ